jgi:hypothetical protein
MVSKTLSVSPARKLRSDPGFPHISLREMSHAHPALLTVFSTTQTDLKIAQSDSSHRGFGDACAFNKNNAGRRGFWYNQKSQLFE